MKRHGRWLAAACIAMVWAFALPLTLPMLRTFFTFDDLQNLFYYVEHPLTSVLSNALVFTPARRPLGALLYLPSYYLFGLEPLPLYSASFLLFNANLALLFSLTLRLTGRLTAAVPAVILCAFHPTIVDVLYNFGAIYELVAFASLVGGLHCWISFRSGKGHRRWYFATMAAFLIGLNAKESAVVLPALLLLYEAVYRPPRPGSATTGAKLVRLHLPFWGMAALYAAMKILPRSSFFTGDPNYRLHPDPQLALENLGTYLRWIAMPPWPASVLATLVALAALAAIGLLLRERTMIFGLGFALTTLTPVLLLDRRWALFLYVPMAGVGLYAGALVSGVASHASRWLGDRLPRGPLWRTTMGLALTLALSCAAMLYSDPLIRPGREAMSTESWRRFAHQLWARYPELSPGVNLGFVEPPFPATRARGEYWCLHFLVWLRYDPAVLVYRIPEQSLEFTEAATHSPESHLLEWRSGILVERPMPVAAPAP